MPLTTTQNALLNYIEQEYLLHGACPTEDSCVQVKVCTEAQYRSAFKAPSFRAALEERGIPLYNLGDPESGRYVLTPEQLVVANVMLDLRDNRSQKKKLSDLGISTGKYEAWLRDPAFQHYVRTRAENVLGDNLHESHLALVDRVRSGDVNAIKYFNEITGRYIPASNGQVDIGSVLMRVLEIIQKYVIDSNVQTLMAEELLELANTVGAKTAPTNRPGTRVIQALPVGVSGFGAGDAAVDF